MFIVRPGINILAMLKASGYSSYRIANESIFGQATLTKFRHGKLPSWNELDKIVKLLHVSPSAIIAWQSDDGNIYDLYGHRLDQSTGSPTDDLPIW